MGWIHVIRNRYVLLVYKRFRNNPFKPKYIFYVLKLVSHILQSITEMNQGLRWRNCSV